MKRLTLCSLQESLHGILCRLHSACCRHTISLTRCKQLCGRVLWGQGRCVGAAGEGWQPLHVQQPKPQACLSQLLHGGKTQVQGTRAFSYQQRGTLSMLRFGCVAAAGLPSEEHTRRGGPLALDTTKTFHTMNVLNIVQLHARHQPFTTWLPLRVLAPARLCRRTSLQVSSRRGLAPIPQPHTHPLAQSSRS